MDCKHCKSEEIRPSQRNAMERTLGYVIPMRPYRCEECDTRQWGLIQPILERPRVITWSVLGVIALLFILNAVLVIEVPAEGDDAATADEQTVQTGAPEQAENAATTETGASEDAAPSGDASADNATPANDDAAANGASDPKPDPEARPVEPADPKEKDTETANAAASPSSSQDNVDEDTTPTPEAAPPSPFVLRQQAKNLAKQNPELAKNNPSQVARPKPKQKPDPKRTTVKKVANKETRRPTATGAKMPVTLSLKNAEEVLTIDIQTKGTMGEADIKTFLLRDKKLIIDFPGRFALGAKTYPARHTVVRQVRTGPHDKYMRLVLDLNDTRNPNPEITRTPTGALIRISPQ